MKLIDGGWWLGRYYLTFLLDETSASYHTEWFDDALSALERLGR